jgi:MFS family permease
MFWSTSAFQGVMTVVSFFAFHETYPQLILRRRAEKKRSETCDRRYVPATERLHVETSPINAISRSLTRPLRLLVFHPIVQLISVISALNYGMLYIILATFSDLWVVAYGQPVDISGLNYIAVALGEIVGSQISGYVMDSIYRRLKTRAGDAGRPEYHIPMMLPGAILAPAGFLLYGWAAQSHKHWIVVDIGMFVTTFGLQIAGMPTQAYIIDSYPEHASSATAASQLLRSLMAFTFPLFAPTMYHALGYGWGNSLLALITLIFGVTAPLLLWWCGPRLRARARESY